MNKRLLSAEQINNLLKNPNVIKCSPKSIGYSPQFKDWAVKQYEERGWSCAKIFTEAGFDLRIIGESTPKNRLKSWRRLKKLKGFEALATDGRGKCKGCGKGRPRMKGLTDAEKFERLEATVAYLKAENDFLIKLRGGKTE